MTEIRVKELYVAKKIYTGKSRDGEPYEIIVVQRQGARQPKIAISVGNVPSGIGVNGAFKITYIKSVMHRKWRDKKSGKWYDGSVTVRANVRAMPNVNVEEAENVHYSYKNRKPEFGSLEEFFDAL